MEIVRYDLLSLKRKKSKIVTQYVRWNSRYEMRGEKEGAYLNEEFLDDKDNRTDKNSKQEFCNLRKS